MRALARVRGLLAAIRWQIRWQTWRRGWDSNPRARESRLFSSPDPALSRPWSHVRPRAARQAPVSAGAARFDGAFDGRLRALARVLEAIGQGAIAGIAAMAVALLVIGAVVR